MFWGVSDWFNRTTSMELDRSSPSSLVGYTEAIALHANLDETQMDIRLLRYFLTVANEGNFTRAASALHLTQPTLSRQIQDLERELNTLLFVREARQVTLTQEGHLLKQRAEEILSLVDKTRDEFQSFSEHLTGTVRIGAGETLAIEDVARVLAKVHQRYPGIHFHWVSGNADDIVERLEKGLIDFAHVIDPFNIAPYESLTLPFVDTWGLVMREDAPLAQKRVIHKEDLLGIPLLCSRQAMEHAREMGDFGAWFGATLKELNMVGNFNLIFNMALMVKHGFGYAVGLDRLLNATEAGKGVVFRPFAPSLTARNYVIWKKTQVFSPASLVVLRALKEAFSGKATDRESNP